MGRLLYFTAFLDPEFCQDCLCPFPLTFRSIVYTPPYSFGVSQCVCLLTDDDVFSNFVPNTCRVECPPLGGLNGVQKVRMRVAKTDILEILLKFRQLICWVGSSTPP